MWSRNGKPIISAPHIFRSIQHLFEENPDLVLDGELFAEKNIADFNKIISCVRKTKPTLQDLHESKKYIKYYIYDIPSLEGNFWHRKTYLNSLELPEEIVVVPTTFCYNQEELDSCYKDYLENGYEGQMIRTDSLYENKRSKFLLKRKEFFDDDFIIHDVLEGRGDMKGKIGKLVLQTKEGVIFESAINISWVESEKLWKQKEDLIGKIATIKYFEKTPDGSLRFPKCIAIRDYE
jgi:ATP-dependent DNA ligase